MDNLEESVDARKQSMGNLGESVDTLRQRVDLLEVSSQEKRKPWYRQPSNIVAIIALLVSIASTIYSQTARETLIKLSAFHNRSS